MRADAFREAPACGAAYFGREGSFFCSLPAGHFCSNRHVWVSDGDDQIWVFYDGVDGARLFTPWGAPP